MRKRGQTALEYMMIITIAIVMIAALWYFLKGTKSETTFETTKDYYDYFIDIESKSSVTPLMCALTTCASIGQEPRNLAILHLALSGQECYAAEIR